MLEVLTAATSHDLTTITAVASEIGTLTSDQKGWVGRQITFASSLIEQEANQVFAEQEYKETLEGSGSPELMLDRTPVLGTPSILSTSNEVIVDFVVEDAASGLLYRRLGWTQEVSYLGGSITLDPLGFETHPGFVVTYDAGYHLPSFEEAATDTQVPLPGNVEQACILTVKAWWHKKNRDSTVSWKQVGDLALGFRGDAAAKKGPDSGALMLPPEARGLIKPRIF
jgi:hypothetical protein